MSALKDRVKTALQENRILVLGTQVVLPGPPSTCAAEKVAGTAVGLGLGVGGAVVGLGLFHGFTEVQRRRRAPEIDKRKAMNRQEEKAEGKTSVKDKIGHVLIESRMVLPGAQALLGFQLAIILQESFDALPASSKWVHLASLACVALSILLLMTPAAYHRIVEQGEETEHFHKVASRLLLAASVPLALGLSGDCFVVVRKVLDSTPAALLAAGLNLLLCLGLWFGLSLMQRARRGRPLGSRRPVHV